MARKCLFSILLLICAFFATTVPLSAQEEQGEIIVISERVVKEIDLEEIQAEKHLYQNLSKPQTVSSDSGEIQEQKTYLYSNPGISIYFELLGKGFYSINIDNRINRSKAISFGLSVLGVWAIQPSIMFYKFSGAKYRFELGIGLSSIIVESHGIVWIFVNGVVGYRYQQKNGLLFRIGFTPILGFEAEEVIFFPSVGISLGYSF